MGYFRSRLPVLFRVNGMVSRRTHGSAAVVGSPELVIYPMGWCWLAALIPWCAYGNRIVRESGSNISSRADGRQKCVISSWLQAKICWIVLYDLIISSIQ